ncbi:MAG: tetratricopeptide repeat protein [Chthoniobacterales bacterium]|nr:tetratricopeptide repeat protein [Chthoniobacterales bacterium]
MRPVRWWVRGKQILAPILLLLAALGSYAPGLRNGFVWDDQALILRDPLIRSWRLIWDGFQHFLFTDAAASDFYRPLQRLSYTLDYAAFFVSPFGYHLVSILWHAAAAIALFYFAEEFLARSKIEPARRLGIAFLAALVWVVHPVQSAAVVYVSGRADPLAAAFGFLALFLGLCTLRASGNRKWAFALGAGLSFLVSALSKEMGLIFLLAWLIIVVAQRRRGALLGTVGMIAAVLVAYLGLRLPAEHVAPPVPPSIPALVRPIVAARAVAEYAGVLAFPWHLHMERDVESHPTGFESASLDASSWRELQNLLGIVLGAIFLYGLWRARHRPAIFLPLLLALVCYLPVSGLITLNATVAEHWLYLPSAFLFLAAATALASTEGKTWWLRIAGVCLTTWVLWLPARTFARTFDWKDQRTFLTRTIADSGDSARMLINLGGLELSEDHLSAARQALERALAKEPGNPLAELNLAAVKIKQGELSGAREILKKITEPPELRARAEESMAVLENRETGKVNLFRLRLASRLGPPNWAIEQRYIKALADLGFPDRGITELKICLAVAPYRSESWLMLSQVLLKAGRADEAVAALAAAGARDVHLHERLVLQARPGQ